MPVPGSAVHLAALITRDGPLDDEPTGDLDTGTGEEILQLLRALQRGHGLTLVIVTHDGRIASEADRIIRPIDRRIVLTVGSVS